MNAITCFYANIGYDRLECDVKPNFSWDEPIGVKRLGQESAVPMFRYGLNDIKNAFVDPVQYIVDNYKSGQNSILLAEADGNSDIKLQNVTSNAWGNLFRIINEISIQQASWNVVSTDPEHYVNLGDEVLCLNGVNGLNSAIRYQASSLTMRNSGVGDNRLSYASLKLRIDDGAVGPYVIFTVYFDPNYFIETASAANFKVYAYEDMQVYGQEGYDTINQNEFDTRIVSTLHTILKTGKYKRVDTLVTKHNIGRNPDANTDPEDDTFQEQVFQTFYIFSNRAESPASLVSSDDKIKAVQQYLIGNDNSEQHLGELISEYPDLFTRDTVNVYPIYDNKITTGTGAGTTLHPLAAAKLKEFLQRWGYTLEPTGNPYELFYVGASNSMGSYIYNFPLIAMESSPTSLITNSISTRFPNYIPKFNLGAIDTDSTPEDTFQMLLLIALNIITGVITLTDGNLVLPDEFTPYRYEYHEAVGITPAYVVFYYYRNYWNIWGPKT
jgi:hypothetical protein